MFFLQPIDLDRLIIVAHLILYLHPIIDSELCLERLMPWKI